MAFNLNKAPTFKDTYVLQLKDAITDELLFEDDKQEVPVTITLFGKSSKQYRNAVTAMQNRELRRKAKKDTATAEQIQKESTDLLVACSATSTLELDGEVVDNKAAFEKLYQNTELSWIRDQVDAALGDDSNFLVK
jgi:hypothetical protein